MTKVCFIIGRGTIKICGGMMDVASALAEFANLLQIGSISLQELAASSMSSDNEGCLREVEGIADRLGEIGRQIATSRSAP